MSHTLASPPSDQKSQRLKIHAADYGMILMPVLVTLHRRRCEIRELNYAIADETGVNGHLEFCLMSPSAHRHVVPRWLENVIGVLAAEDLTCELRT